MVKFSMPSNPVTTRPDGSKEVWGQTGWEWFVSVGALFILWTIMGCIFALFLFVAQTIRDTHGLFLRPERMPCLPGNQGCKLIFDHIPALCGTGTNPKC